MGLPGSGDHVEGLERRGAGSIAQELRERLRDFSVAIRPGETLVVLAHPGWTPEQMYQYQQRAEEMAAMEGLPFKVLFVPGAQLALVSDEVPGEHQ